jgi:hypothetical protein
MFTLHCIKSQGQSLKAFGIYLREEYFPHGRLYVLFSKVDSAKGLNILASTQKKVLFMTFCVLNFYHNVQ